MRSMSGWYYNYFKTSIFSKLGADRGSHDDATCEIPTFEFSRNVFYGGVGEYL